MLCICFEFWWGTVKRNNNNNNRNVYNANTYVWHIFYRAFDNLLPLFFSSCYYVSQNAVTGYSFFCYSANTQHLFWSGAHDSIVWIETIINLLLLFNVISFLFFCLAFRLSKNKVANANKNKHTHLTRNGKLKIWIMTNGTIRTHFIYTYTEHTMIYAFLAIFLWFSRHY